LIDLVKYPSWLLIDLVKTELSIHLLLNKKNYQNNIVLILLKNKINSPNLYPELSFKSITSMVITEKPSHVIFKVKIHSKKHTFKSFYDLNLWNRFKCTSFGIKTNFFYFYFFIFLLRINSLLQVDFIS